MFDKDKIAENYLAGLLLDLPTGGKLPGIRSLVLESGIGRIRIEHALKKLCDAGKVAVRSRSGYYRSIGNDSDKRILLAHFNPENPAKSNDSFFGSFWNIFKNELTMICRQNGYELVKHSFYGKLSQVGSFFKHNTFACAIIQSSGGCEITELFSSHLCCVDVLPFNNDLAYPALLDSPDMLIMQMEYLMNRGYRKIAYLHQCDNIRQVVHLNRICDYYRIMAENHIAINSNWCMRAGYDWESFNCKLHKLLDSSYAPDALIVPGNTIPAVYRFCRNNGIIIGKDLAIIGCDDLSQELSPRVTSVTNNPVEIAQQTWRILSAAMRGEKIIEYTNLKIVTGESVPVKS